MTTKSTTRAAGADKKPTEKSFTAAQLDAAVAKAKDGLFTQADLDAAVAEAQGHGKGLYTQAELDAAIAEAVKGAAPSPSDEKPKVAPALAIADGAEAPGLVALTGATRIVFADDDGRGIKGLSPLTFGPGDYEPGGSRAVLKKDIEFPTGVARVAVAAAFLLDGDTIVGRAALVQPFWVGGGRQAKLPGGTLSFAGARKAPAAAQPATA